MNPPELPARLFHDCLSPTDSSTPVRFQSRLIEAAGDLHVEACADLDLDRKYNFSLPALEERTAYLALWRTKLGDRIAWSEPLLARIAAGTEGFSFAYLQELVIATLSRAVAEQVEFASLLESECATLRGQMSSIQQRAREATPATDD